MSDSESSSSQAVRLSSKRPARQAPETAPKKQRKLQRKEAFCVVDLNKCDMSKFALTDLGAFRSSKYVYPKAYYSDKKASFKLSNARITKVCRDTALTLLYQHI